MIVKKFGVFILLFYVQFFSANGQSPVPFDSNPLKEKGDLSVLMVEGIDRFLIGETERIRRARSGLWKRDFASAQAFNQSIRSEREMLAGILGIVDERAYPGMELMTDGQLQQLSVEMEDCFIRAVKWKVLDGKYHGLSAEGLFLQPKGKVLGSIIMLPDADVIPEVYAGLKNPDAPEFGIARKLAEAGMEVLIPVMINRDDTFSGSQLIGRFTNQPHREWIYRQGFILGRHIIGYELQKIFAAIDWLESRNQETVDKVPIGVAGYGEGGLLALHASALDTRISSTLVSGYFDAREQIWQEPIYRNVFGSLKYFGDAELAVMAWPRSLYIENARTANISGPPAPSQGRSGAAPGRLKTPEIASAKAEWERASSMLPADQNHLHWFTNEGSAFDQAFSPAVLKEFLKGLDIELATLSSPTPPPVKLDPWINSRDRQERTVRDIEYQMQRVLGLSEGVREQNFWQTLKGDTSSQKQVKDVHRKQFWEVIGRLPPPSLPANPRSRKLEETANWTSYEIVLDVWPEVFAWGVLLIPKNRKQGERLPAVVCQHGLEGVPLDLISTDPETPAYKTYKGFAAALADRGYAVFVPFNPYRGEDKFRVLQRKANPLGLSLFSFITGQHQRIVDWLGQQDFIDPARIGFYGLSYGGKTAVRVPVLVEGYALSICSGDFNEWIRKVASTDDDAFNSYPFTKEYEMPEWNLAHTFSYAEMAALIAPRPFMVERGHQDGVGTDEWVAYEFAKVRRHYDFLGLPDSQRIEYFNGPHTIHGKGTFDFLDLHLKNR